MKEENALKAPPCMSSYGGMKPSGGSMSKKWSCRGRWRSQAAGQQQGPGGSPAHVPLQSTGEPGLSPLRWLPQPSHPRRVAATLHSASVFTGTPCVCPQGRHPRLGPTRSSVTPSERLHRMETDLFPNKAESEGSRGSECGALLTPSPHSTESVTNTVQGTQRVLQPAAPRRQHLT